MNSPCLHSLINPSALSSQSYFRSLVEQALGCGLLRPEDVPRFRRELMEILFAQRTRLDGGENSSVPASVARSMMDSIAFVIGMELKFCPDPDSAATMLRDFPLEGIFSAGLERGKMKLVLASHIHRKIMGGLFDTPNVFWKTTAVDGIAAFFRVYSLDTAAHETHITADYPLCLGRPDSCGIEFILEYLRGLDAENSFLLRFAPMDVHRLMLGVSGDYASCPVNVFETAVLAAAALACAGRSCRRLDPSASDISSLAERIRGLDSGGIRGVLETALEGVDMEIGIPAESRAYLRRCLDVLARTVSVASGLEALGRLIPSR